MSGKFRLRIRAVRVDRRAFNMRAAIVRAHPFARTAAAPPAPALAASAFARDALRLNAIAPEFLWRRARSNSIEIAGGQSGFTARKILDASDRRRSVLGCVWCAIATAPPTPTLAFAAAFTLWLPISAGLSIAAHLHLSMRMRRAFFANVFLFDVFNLGFFGFLDHVFGLENGFRRWCELGPLIRRALTDALDLEIAGHDAVLGLELDGHAVVHFDARQFAALLIQRVHRHVDRDANDKCIGALALALFVERAQHAQRRGFHGPHDTLAAAMRARNGRSGDDARPQPLARHLQETELADLADLDARAIVFHRVSDALFDIAVVAAVFHVDEVDDDQARQVAQAE
ncbi:MAG: hypothetical protein ABSC92_16925, partial [Rhizomicrobium sp.]